MIITVDSALLRQAIRQMSALYKNNEQFRAFNLTVKNSKLYLNVNTGLRYEAIIPLNSSVSEEVSVNLIYRDITEILNDVGEIRLEVTSMYCTVTTGVFEINLSMANEVVQPMFHKKKAEPSYMPKEQFGAIVKTLCNTPNFRKAYKITPLLTFNGDSSYVKYPTMWMKTTGGYIHSNLTRDMADVIIAFVPDSYCEEGELIYFYNDIATLIVPSAVPSDDTFDAMREGLKEVCEIDFGTVVPALRKVHHVLGDGNLMLYFSKRGMRLSVMRAGVSSLLYFGEPGEITATVQLPLEFFLNIAMVLNRATTISYGGGKICLDNNLCSILMSVNN